ncbi:MAG: flagellar hook capping protein [Clostridiales bacterium]|jgi:flagellar basal-body rod modification protein FlgD|nr:flagellar hook capping protein [Clostridiales bacterium]
MPISAANSTDRNYTDLIGSGTNKTEKKGEVYNAVFENNKDTSIKYEDFFSLMLHQLSNQDFMNPVDDTQYLSQLAQIASMQAMQEMAQYEKANYSMSFLGKEVTVAKNNIGGTISKDRGIITQISLLNGEYKITVNDKTYELSEIMLVHDSSSPAKDSNTPSTDESTDS